MFVLIHVFDQSEVLVQPWAQAADVGQRGIVQVFIYISISIYMYISIFMSQLP